MFKKTSRPVAVKENVIDIEVGMEGNLKFSSPVNLKISGKFKGELEMKGILTIGQAADVKVRVIKGEDITILGKVVGDIICTRRLVISPPAKVVGNIQTPSLIINEGAMVKGDCQMPLEGEKVEVKGNPEPKKGSRSKKKR